jgi:hypothetical protein
VAGVALLALVCSCHGESEEAGSLRGRAVAKASVDVEDVAFGDDIIFALEVRSDPVLEVELPHPAELEGFRIVDAGTSRSEQRGVTA